MAPTFAADLAGQPGEGWEPSVRWVIGDITDLITAGAAAARELPLEQMLLSLKVLERILELVESTDASEVKDALTHAINSPRGKSIEALLNVALAIRRFELSKELQPRETWVCVGLSFEKELLSSESGKNADFSALAGAYCPKLHAINEKWVEDNFDRLFSKSNNAA